MIIVIEADYREEEARGHVAGILCESALVSEPVRVITGIVEQIGDYQPGFFYRRELQCVEQVLKQVDIQSVDTILIDGYANFGDERKSLGTYVYNEYHIPVIGIAKNRFKSCLIENTEVYRGNSLKPLFVTSVGMEPEAAKEIVKKMAGKNRIPVLVKKADACARDWSL